MISQRGALVGAAVVLSLVLCAGTITWAATIDVSQSVHLTANTDYDRNPSVISDGTDYWLFYTKGDHTAPAVRGMDGYDPDGDAYVVYYKRAATIGLLASAAETKLTRSAPPTRPANFDQRVVSATYIGGKIYAFVSSGQSGTDRGLYYYEYNGTSWTGPVIFLADTGVPNRGGHVNVTSDASYVYIVWECSDGSSDCYVWDPLAAKSLQNIAAGKIDISNDNMPKITLLGTDLYVVSIEDGTGDIEVHHAAAGVSPSFTHHSTAVSGVGYYDPCIFNDGTDLYVVTAPYVGGNDQQYLVQTRSFGAGTTWEPARTISFGGYAGTYWWDYWPVGYHDGADAYVFFTTESSSPQFGDAEIAVSRMDWDLGNDHYFYIQNAVSQAVAGDLVSVASDTYEESVAIPATFNGGTLSGATASRPVITGGMTFASGSDGLAVENFVLHGSATANNSVLRALGTIANFTLDNCVIDGENVAGRLGYSGGSVYDDLTVTGCEFLNILGWAVFDTRSGSGGDGSPIGTITFTGNHIHECNGTIALRGLSTDLTDYVEIASNVWENIGGNQSEMGEHWAAFEANHAVSCAIYDNTIANVAEGQWGEGQAFQLWDIGTLDVHDNTITDCFQGIYIYGGASGSPYGGPYPVPGGSFYHNTILNCDQYSLSVDANATGGPLDIEENFWGTVNFQAIGALTLGNVDFDPWCVDGSYSDCTLNEAALADVYVDDDWDGLTDGDDLGSGLYFNYNAFATIQDGIDNVSGSTVHVAAGTYTAVDRALAIIDKPILLEGAGQSDDLSGTILYGSTYGLTQDNTGLGVPWPRAIVVQTNDVTIRNLRIKGYQGDQVSYGGYAIVARAQVAWGVTATSIDNLTVEDVTFDDCFYGVRAQSVNEATVQQTNYLINTGEPDYAVYISTSTGTTIQENTFDRSAIWVTDATDGVIGGPNPSDGNVLTNINYNGIWYGQQFAPGTSSERGLIQNNSISGAGEGGIVVWNWGGETADSILILDNYITGAAGGSDEHGGISIYQGIFTNLVISGNTTTANADNQPGILFATNTLTSARVTNNIITDNPAEGIRFSSVTRGDVVIFDNNVSGNAGGITITGGTTGTLDASANWWGSSDPAVVGTVNGAAVDYTPWLASSTDTGTDPGFQGDFATLWVDDDSPQAGTIERIQEGVDLLSGSTLNIANGLYLTDATYISAPTTVIGESRAGVVIAPLSTYAEGSVHPTAFIYQSSDVTIQTLTIDGQANPGLTPGVNNFRTGITADNSANYGNIRIEDVTLQNINRRAVQIINPAPPRTTGNVMTNCTVENVDQYGAFTCWYADAEVTSNIFGPATGTRIQNTYSHVEAHGNQIDASNATFGIVTYSSGAEPVLGRGSMNVSNNTITGAHWAIACQGDGDIYDNDIFITEEGGIGIFSAGDRYPIPNDINIQGNTIEIDANNAVGLNLVDLLDGSLVGGPAPGDENGIIMTPPVKQEGDAGTVSAAAFARLIGEPDGPPPAAAKSAMAGGSGNIGMLVWWCPPGNRLTIENNDVTCEGDGVGIWLYHNDATAAPMIVDNRLSSTSSTSADPSQGVGVFITDDPAYVGETGGGDSHGELSTNTIKGFVTGVSLYRNAGHSVVATVAGDSIYNNTNGIRVTNDALLDNVTGAVITQNSENGIFVATEVSGGTVGTIYHNKLFANGQYAVNNTTGVAIDAAENWWGSNCGPIHTSNPSGQGDAITDYVTYEPWCDVIFVKCDFTTGSFPPAEVWVDDDYTPEGANDGHYWCYDAFDNIQSGVDAVAEGGTVNALEGIYEQQVVIARDVSILGDGPGLTIVQSPPSLPDYFISSGTTQNHPIIYAHDAASVQLSGMTIDGLGRGNANYRFEGIGFHQAGGAIADCEIVNIQDTPFSGSQHGTAIYVLDDAAPARTLSVTDVSISSFQKNGVALIGEYLTSDVNGCVVTGVGPTTVTAQNGIQISLGAGTVTGCTVANVAYSPATWAASGMLFHNVSHFEVIGGTISGSQASVLCQESQGSISGLTVNSTFVDYAEGVSVRDYGAIKSVSGTRSMIPASPLDEELLASVTKGTATSVSITGCDLFGVHEPNSYAVAVWSLGDDVHATLSDNNISDWEVGVVAYEDGSAVSVSAIGNRIVSNDDVAFWTNAIATQDASGNWWGNTDPVVVAGSVSAGVDYTPWLGSGTTTAPGFTGDFSELWVDDDSPQSGAVTRIQEGVDLVIGSLVHVVAGTYEEQVVIAKPVTVRGEGIGTSIIQSPTALTEFFTTSANNYPIVFAHDADSVVFEDLTIDGLGRGNTIYRFVGAGFYNASGSMTRCEIKDIRNDPINGSQHGNGVYAYAATLPARQVTLEACDIIGFQKTGAVFVGTMMAGTVHACTVEGYGPANFIAQNGIQIGPDASGSAVKNIISGLSYTGPTYGSCGILIYDAAGTVNCDSNTVSECQLGINFNDAAGSVSHNAVSATPAGTGLSDYWAVAGTYAAATSQQKSSGNISAFDADLKSVADKAEPQVFTWIVSGNTLDGAGASGSYGLEAYVYGSGQLSLVALSNQITNNSQGMALYDDNTATLTSTLTFNEIVSNGIGLNNDGGGIQAQNNRFDNVSNASDNQPGNLYDHNCWSDYLPPPLYYDVPGGGGNRDNNPDETCGLCSCPYQADFDTDGYRTALDLSVMIDILFAGHSNDQDPSCPSPRADFDCDGFSTALDLSGMIDHLFAGGPVPCDPCAP